MSRLNRNNALQLARPTRPLAGLPVLTLAVMAAVMATVAVCQTASAATLGDAISAAVARADQGQRAEALRQQGQAVQAQAQSLVADDPALRVMHLSDRLTEDTGYYEWQAMVDLPLWLPGQRSARRALANALGLQADALERYLRWEIAGRVRETAWAVALAEGQMHVAEHAAKDAKTLEDQVSKRVAAGELARLDLLLAQQDTLAREAELQAKRAELQLASQRLALLTGSEHLPDPLQEPLPDPLPKAAAPDEGLAPDHPGLAAAEAKVAQALAERTRVATERRANPTLSLGGKRTRDSRDSDPYTALALEINVPFGLGSQSAPRLAEAERVYTDTAAERARVRRELETELALARTSRAAAAEALATARRQRALAAESLGLMQRGFALGEIDLATLLRERTRARETELALETRRLELGRAAARLNQALGVVPP